MKKETNWSQILIVLIIGIYVSWLINTPKPMMIKPENHNAFTVNYKNITEETKTLRYKTILSYETAKDFKIPFKWKNEDYLFNLVSDNKTITESPLSEKGRPSLPVISDTFYIKPGEITNFSFQMNVNEKAEDFQDKIRFEVKIIVEEMKNKMWTPVYQVNLMERGPYWSLDKGPIEFLPNDK